METILYWAAALVAIATALAVIRKLVAPMFRFTRRWDMFLEDWHGSPARPGRPAVPGVMERLVALEGLALTLKHEVLPNSGGSLRDAVDRLEREVGHVRTSVSPVDATR